MESFMVGKDEKRRRWTNVGWGLLFSAAMIALVTFEHQRDPERYSSLLFWSVTWILTAANLANLIFLLRYLRLIRDHRLELVPGTGTAPGKLRFFGAGKWTELELEQITTIRLFKRWGKLRHIQLVLRNNRGIRLEGYEDLPRLAESLQASLPRGKAMPLK